MQHSAGTGELRPILKGQWTINVLTEVTLKQQCAREAGIRATLENLEHCLQTSPAVEPGDEPAVSLAGRETRRFATESGGEKPCFLCSLPPLPHILHKTGIF